MSSKPSNKIFRHEKGLISFAYLVVAFVVVTIGIVGYIVLVKNSANDSSTSETSPPPQQPSVSSEKNQEQTPSEGILYENKNAGYSVEYPSGWFITEAQSANSAVSISNVDLNTKNSDRFKVDIVVLSNPSSMSLEQFVASQDQQNEQNLGTSITSRGQSLTTIDSSPALKRTVTSNGSTSWTVYISKNDKVYLIVGNEKAGFASYFEAITQSFKATRQ